MKVLAFNFSFPNQVSFSLITLHKNVPSKLLSHRNNTPYLAGEQTGGAISKQIFIGTKGKLCFTHLSSKKNGVKSRRGRGKAGHHLMCGKMQLKIFENWHSLQFIVSSCREFQYETSTTSKLPHSASSAKSKLGNVSH